MSRSMLFQRPVTRSFIPADYSRLQTEMAESKMGEEEACLNEKQKKEIQVKRCDSRGPHNFCLGLALVELV